MKIVCLFFAVIAWMIAGLGVHVGMYSTAVTIFGLGLWCLFIFLAIVVEDCTVVISNTIKNKK